MNLRFGSGLVVLVVVVVAVAVAVVVVVVLVLVLVLVVVVVVLLLLLLLLVGDMNPYFFYMMKLTGPASLLEGHSVQNTKSDDCCNENSIISIQCT